MELQFEPVVGFCILLSIFNYLNYNHKISLLEKKLDEYKIIDEILNMKILALENNIKSLEEFRSIAYEKNLIMNYEDEEECGAISKDCRRTESKNAQFVLLSGRDHKYSKYQKRDNQ